MMLMIHGSKLRALLAILGILVCSKVQAGGYSYPESGAVALSRGGAFVAKADDPSALYFNPAGAARLKGTHIILNTNLISENVHYQRQIYSTDPNNPLLIDRYPHDSSLQIPQIANSDGFFPSPFFAVTSDLGFLQPYRVVFMAGIYGPNSHMFHTFPRYCEPGSNPCIPTDSSGIASPSRYDTISTNVLVLYPTFGVAWEIFDGLSVGGVVQIGYAQLTYNLVVGALIGENPQQDIDVELKSSSPLTPTGIFGVHWRAFEFLELGAAMSMGLTYNTTGNICVGKKEGDNCIGINEKLISSLPFKINASPNPSEASLEVPMPWVVRTGARYVQHDIAKRELFDIELDFIWESNSVLKAFTVKPDPPINLINDETGEPLAGMTIKEISVAHNWTNSWSLRLGGSYTFYDIFRNASLTVRAGGLFESSAVPYEYTRLDFWPFNRGGVGGGVGLQWENYEFNLGYFHLFFEERNIAPPDWGSAVKEIVPIVPGVNKLGGPVGNGIYRISIGQIILGMKTIF